MFSSLKWHSLNIFLRATINWILFNETEVHQIRHAYLINIEIFH